MSDFSFPQTEAPLDLNNITQEVKTHGLVPSNTLEQAIQFASNQVRSSLPDIGLHDYSPSEIIELVKGSVLQNLPQEVQGVFHSELQSLIDENPKVILKYFDSSIQQ